MTKDDYSTGIELYGVSPTVIGIIMFLITIIAPYGYIPQSFGSVFMIFLDPKVYSFLWEVPMGGYTRIIVPNVFGMLPLTILNWLYAYWIVRYYQAKSSRYSAVMIGLVSILAPLLISLYITGMFGDFRVIYPIPIQFILGLVILWRIEGPEVISPWSGMRLDLSWWKWKRAKRKSDWDPFEDEKRALEENSE